MSTTIIGFPRLGEFRELKFTTEKYFRNEITAEDLLDAAKNCVPNTGTLSKKKASLKSHQMTFLTMTTSSMLLSFSTWFLHLFKTWTCLTLNATCLGAWLPRGEKGDVRALPMKKWFNTNYHYIVPKFEKNNRSQIGWSQDF